MNNKTLVFNLVKLIPAGKVATYGQISRCLGLGSARLVGQILHGNLDPDAIPCHRVVFADGSLSRNYAFGKKKEQKKKLIKEGVSFIGDKVNLKLDKLASLKANF